MFFSEVSRLNVWIRIKEKGKLVNLQMVYTPPTLQSQSTQWPQHLRFLGMRQGSHQWHGRRNCCSRHDAVRAGMEIVKELRISSPSSGSTPTSSSRSSRSPLIIGLTELTHTAESPCPVVYYPRFSFEYGLVLASFSLEFAAYLNEVIVTVGGCPVYDWVTPKLL